MHTRDERRGRSKPATPAAGRYPTPTHIRVEPRRLARAESRSNEVLDIRDRAYVLLERIVHFNGWLRVAGLNESKTKVNEHAWDDIVKLQ